MTQDYLTDLFEGSEDSYLEYYNDFVLTELVFIVRDLKYRDHGCEKINNILLKKSEKELICEIINNYYQTNTVKLNFHCETFIAKMSWVENSKSWKIIKNILD